MISISVFYDANIYAIDLNFITQTSFIHFKFEFSISYSVQRAIKIYPFFYC